MTTAPNRQFVDLRLLKPASPSSSYTELDWGFGGRSVGKSPHGEWIHDIDSHTTEPESDSGVSSPHPTLPDVSLERGTMRHPGSGEMREYEEAWKHLDVLPVGPGGGVHEGQRVSVFLETGQAGDRRRGMVCRVGQFVQGIVRDGDDVSVQRWAWDEEEREWKPVARIGHAAMACDVTWKDEVNDGDIIVRDGVEWTVKALRVW